MDLIAKIIVVLGLLFFVSCRSSEPMNVKPAKPVDLSGSEYRPKPPSDFTNTGGDENRLNDLREDLIGPPPRADDSNVSMTNRIVGVLYGLISATQDLFFRILRDESRIGSVITRWGNGKVPASLAALGGSLVYSGYGYGSFYTHGNRENECVQGGDPGPSWSGNYSDVIFPTVTGNAIYIPSNIPELKIVACAKILVRSVTTVIHGSDSCPANWVKLYSGFEMAGHYSHAGRGTNPLCIDEDFDTTTPSYSEPGHYSYIYGTYLSEGIAQLSGTHAPMKYLKCAVCAAN